MYFSLLLKYSGKIDKTKKKKLCDIHTNEVKDAGKTIMRNLISKEFTVVLIFISTTAHFVY